MEPAIHVADLTKRFGDVTAVDHLSLSVYPGEIFGLVGPDGAGKTTTLRMVATIMDASSGDTRVAGIDVRREPGSAKDHIAYMSQRFGLYQDLTVQENIEFYADLYCVPGRERQDRIDKLLDFSDMRRFKARRAGHLSGGMKQKLQLICALIHTPTVLLLDEPTNGVDPVSRRDFWRILYRLLKENTAILISTAYLDEAERCNRIGLIDRGTMHAVGTPAQVKGLMRAVILELRSSQARRITHMLRDLGQYQDVNVFGDHVHVVSQDPNEAERHIRRLLDDQGIPYDEIRRQPASLEDVFISLLDLRSSSQSRTSVDIEAGSDRASRSISGKWNVAVSMKELTRYFGDFVAVNRVTVDVPRGEIFGFLGPNGAGKTTVIRMLCGLLKPTQGGGTVAGYDISREPERIKRRIGYMSQKFSLYDDLTVEENINFYGGIYGLRGTRLAKRRDWALQMTGLRDQRRNLTSHLSAGWKQGLAMACAVLHEPPILFLDEPTSGVDPLSRRRFWDLIYDMANRGITIFVTTHYMEEAEYCDRIALMFRGSIIAIGSPRELKTQRMHEQILDIRCPQPQDVIDPLGDVPGVHSVALFGEGLHAVVENATRARRAIAQTLYRLGVRVERMEEIAPSMEDVFVSLIEEVEKKEAKYTQEETRSRTFKW